MLSKSKLVYFLFTVIFLAGCQKQIKVNFSQTLRLTGHPVEEINLFSRGNVSLCVADTFLVIQKSEAPFFRIYSTNTHKLLAEFGTRGLGPAEFISPTITKQIGFESENESPVIYVFDFKRQLLSTINILNLINDSTYKAPQNRLPGNNFLKFFHYKSKHFYLASPATPARLQIYNSQTSENKLIGYIPKPDYMIPAGIISQIYRSTAVVNTKEKLIAAAPALLGELDFFDLNGTLIKSTIFGSQIAIKNDKSSLENPKYQIIELVKKNNLIYGLNYNTKVKKWGTKKEGYNVKVQVFNWSGKPIKEFVLGSRFITSFAIDTLHQRIYAYSPTEADHTIISYTMK